MRSATLLCALTVGLAVSTPATAQVYDAANVYHPPPPSKPDEWYIQYELDSEADQNEDDATSSIPFRFRSLAEQRQAYLLASDFARCAIGFDRKRASDLIDRQSGGGSSIEQEQRYYDRFRLCAKERAVVDRDFMIGALATDLLLRDEQAAEAASARTLEELLEFLRWVEIDEGGAGNAIASAQLTFQCRAAVVPSAAYRVLEQEPDSEPERVAMTRLAEQTPACDTLMGEHDLGAWFARAYTARGLYHWSRFREQHPVP